MSTETRSGAMVLPPGYSDQAGFVLILGMHRSGTSCLAGCLERCGLFLGNVSRYGPYNAKGNHELKKVAQLHNQILIANGGTWRQPPASVAIDSRQRQVMAKVAARLARHRHCGLKDPRLLLLLDSWVEAVAPIAGSWTLVGIYRHPVAVAQSLAQRDQIPAEEAYNLWLRYNTELVYWHKRYHFPIVEYDLSDEEQYCRTVAALAARLGLEPNLPFMREFVSAELEHCRIVPSSVPAVCQELYAYLQDQRYRPAIADDDIPPEWLTRRYLLSPERIRQVFQPARRFLFHLQMLVRRSLRRLYRLAVR